MPILKMLTGLCGPDYSLVRDDEREFDEREASSLIRAGFAVATDDFEPLPLEGEEPAELVDDTAAAEVNAAAAEAIVVAAAKPAAAKAKG